MSDPSADTSQSEPSPNPGEDTLVRRILDLPGPVWVLSLGMFINRFGTFVIPFLTLYLIERGYSEESIWLIFAAMAAGGIAASLQGGWLADRFGRRNTMTFSLLSGAASMLLLWRADSMPEYLVTAALSGFTHGIYHPAANSLLADVTRDDQRVTAFALVRWALNLGFAGGMALGGVLAKINYSLLFIGDAVTSATFGVIAFFFLPHGLKTGPSREGRWSEAVRSMRGNRPFIGLFVSNLLVVGLFFQWGGAVSRLVLDLGYTTKDYGRLMAWNGLLVALLEMPLSHWARRFPRRRVIAAGFLICGAGMAMNGLSGGWLMVFWAVTVFTVGEMISMPVSSAYVAELSPPMMRGRYSGVIGLTWSFGNLFAIGAGLVIYRECPALLWIGSLALGILAAIILWCTGEGGRGFGEGMSNRRF